MSYVRSSKEVSNIYIYIYIYILDKRFLRIHRSYIVNLKHIKAFAKGRVFLNDKVSIPVGDNYKESFNSYIEKVYLNL